MIVLILTSLVKLFFFFRIWPRLSTITIMIVRCMVDLGPFLVVFFLQIAFFASTFSVLGHNRGGEDSHEYRKLGLFLGQFLATLRTSVGDFDYEWLNRIDPIEQQIHWVIWTCVFYLGCLIMLNFIIAEVSASYETVKAKIDQMRYQERATMIKEVEDLVPAGMRKRDKHWFPRYFVIKENEKQETPGTGHS